MYAFGCVTFLLLVILVSVIALIGQSLELIGATAVWLWEKLCDQFRPEAQRKNLRSPWSTYGRRDWTRTTYNRPKYTSGEQTSSTDDAEEIYNAPVRPKIYDDREGEYIEFEEIN